ncbi:translocation/assembly module TamB domain-containing protein, partial [Gemmatimonadota bacterium]
RMLVRGSYTDGALNTELTARGPGADSVNVVLTLDTGSGAALGSLYADALRLEAGPAQLPVDVASLRAEFMTASYDALTEGGSLSMAARGIRAWGLVTDSLQARVELGEGRITATEPVQLGGENYALSVAGFYDTSRDAVDLRITGSARAPSQPLAMAGLKLEGGRIDLSLRATGRGTDPDLRGGVNLFDLRQGDMRVARSEMHVAVAQVRGARIGTFAADVDSLFISPGFAVHRGLVDGRVRGERISLQRVEAWWGEGEAALQGEIVVEEGVATATLEEGTLAHGESLLRTIRGGLLYNLADGSGSFTLGGRTGTGHIDIRGRREAGGTLEAEGEFGLLDVGELSRTLKLPGNPEGVLTGSLSAVIGRHVETLDVRAEVADPAVAGHRYRRLDIDAGYDRGIVRIGRLLLSGVEEESVRLAGDLHLPGAEAEGAEGTLRLEAEISDLRLAPLQDYLEGHLISGELTGNLAATGTFAEPRFEGRMSLNYARFDTFQVDSVRMDLSYDGQHLLLRQGLLASMGFNARFDASLPVRVTLDPAGIEIDRGAPVSALLAGRGEPRALVQAIEGEIEQFEGDLDIGLTLAGSLDNPDLTGSAALRNGRLKPRALGQAIQDLEVDITFEQDTARINTLAGRIPSEGVTRRGFLGWLGSLFSGRKEPTGVFAASGTVTITDGRPLYDITLEGEGLGISDPTRSLVAIIDPSLRLTSPATAGEDLLSGTVLVRQGLMDIGMVTRMIGSESEARIERPEAKGGIRTDIEVDIPGRFRVVGTSITLDEDINVEMRGNLLVRRDPPGPVYLTGSLESVPGRGTVYAYSRRWIVDRGNITFGTIEEINPDLDVQLSTLIREAEVEVYITLSGTAREPIARFSSDSPTLTSDTDILQLILLGTTAQGQSGFNVQERMTGFIESALGRRAGEAIGLDTFQVRGIPGVTREEDTQISVGKYLGSQFYVQYSNYLKDFSSQMGELGVEYRINRNFRISLTLDRFRREYLELKWRIEY